MQRLWAEHALTSEGWQQNVLITIDTAGLITDLQVAAKPSLANVEEKFTLLLPAPANLHSHAFQRAMAGLTETQGPQPQDTFWTWRQLMYAFLDKLNPDDLQSIAAFVQMEMLEAGYASVGEFHYLHHQPTGQHYQNQAEMCERIVAAASETGIGLTLLPVFYQQGGCDGRELVGGQKRFAHTPDQYARLLEGVEKLVQGLPPDANYGLAPHSLRAVPQHSLQTLVALSADRPLHIHIAEQQAEVEEIKAAWQARPVQWLLANHEVNSRWCLVHATQMLAPETAALARTGAVAGLCPITESSLGDGIFDGMRYRQAGGQWGVGSDSNIRISLAEELRTLEYSQRLRDRGRAMYAEPTRSTGRVLFDSALSGGAQALQRHSGMIQKGVYADLLALDSGATDLLARSGDGWLDAWIFAADDQLVTDVWSAGRHIVVSGQHIKHEEIEQRYRATLQAILKRL